MAQPVPYSDTVIREARDDALARAETAPDTPTGQSGDASPKCQFLACARALSDVLEARGV